MNRRHARASRHIAIALSIAAVTATGSGASGTTPQAGGPATATLTVHAHVIRNCTVNAQPLDFGRYDPMVANRTQPLDATSTISVTCGRGVAANVELSSGQNPFVQTNIRRMNAGGSDYLDYQIYKTAARTTRWGHNVGHVPASGGNSAAADLTVYGRVFGGQNVAPGSYNDTVTVTVHF